MLHPIEFKANANRTMQLKNTDLPLGKEFSIGSNHELILLVFCVIFYANFVISYALSF